MPERDTDELFQVPLADFVRVRDAIAARRKAGGDKDGAAEVKRARKPSLPAWAANQVVWHAPAEWKRLLAAAAALRRGHERGASPDEIRQATREQREALQACESRAAGFLVASGHAATPVVVQKASGTLQALAYGGTGAEPGRVQEELQPPGFEVLAGMRFAATGPSASPTEATPRPTEATPRPRTDAGRRSEAHDRERENRDRQAREEESSRRRAALAAAESRRLQASRALAQARADLAAQERRLLDLESAVDAERRALTRAREALAAAEGESSAADAALEGRREDA